MFNEKGSGVYTSSWTWKSGLRDMDVRWTVAVCAGMGLCAQDWEELRTKMMPLLGDMQGHDDFPPRVTLGSPHPLDDAPYTRIRRLEPLK